MIDSVNNSKKNINMKILVVGLGLIGGSYCIACDCFTIRTSYKMRLYKRWSSNIKFKKF